MTGRRFHKASPAAWRQHVDVVRRLHAEQNVDHRRARDAVSQADTRRGERLAESPQHNEVLRAAPDQFDRRGDAFGIGKLAVGFIDADHAGEARRQPLDQGTVEDCAGRIVGRAQEKEIGAIQGGNQRISR